VPLPDLLRYKASLLDILFRAVAGIADACIYCSRMHQGRFDMRMDGLYGRMWHGPHNLFARHARYGLPHAYNTFM
jgi:hypothetical protein